MNSLCVSLSLSISITHLLNAFPFWIRYQYYTIQYAHSKNNNNKNRARDRVLRISSLCMCVRVRVFCLSRDCVRCIWGAWYCVIVDVEWHVPSTKSRCELVLFDFLGGNRNKCVPVFDQLEKKTKDMLLKPHK